MLVSGSREVGESLTHLFLRPHCLTSRCILPLHQSGTMIGGVRPGVRRMSSQIVDEVRKVEFGRVSTRSYDERMRTCPSRA